MIMPTLIGSHLIVRQGAPADAFAPEMWSNDQ
jgi:hypothetical protein